MRKNKFKSQDKTRAVKILQCMLLNQNKKVIKKITSMNLWKNQKLNNKYNNPSKKIWEKVI